MCTYYCVVEIQGADDSFEREIGFVVGSSYQDAARKIEENYGSDLNAITYMAAITNSEIVMMAAHHCPTMEATMKEIQKNWIW